MREVFITLKQSLHVATVFKLFSSKLSRSLAIFIFLFGNLSFIPYDYV